jgi:hypothetical protein
MKVKDIKQGDPIVYEINEKAYNGVAVSTPNLGHHPGFKTTSFHINLNYLNEQGQIVKIYGAPLLTKAVGEEELDEMAEFEATAFPGRDDEGRKIIDVPGTKKRIVESVNRTIGWRPSEEGEIIKALKESLASAQASVIELKGELAKAQAQAQQQATALEGASADMEGLKKHVAELQAHAEELSKPVQTEVEALKSQIAELTAENEALKTAPRPPAPEDPGSQN